MDYLSWMRRASITGTGFYAVLAQRMLGDDSGEPPFANETLGLADLEAVAADPRGERAFALLQVGQTHLAEQELRSLYPSIAHDAAMRRAVMLVAWQAGMAILANQIARVDPSHAAAGASASKAVVIPPLLLVAPRGLHMDPSLLYALVRVESNFDPHAVSSQGAQGLLQLMPSTRRIHEQNARRATFGHPCRSSIQSRNGPEIHQLSRWAVIHRRRSAAHPCELQCGTERSRRMEQCADRGTRSSVVYRDDSEQLRHAGSSSA